MIQRLWTWIMSFDLWKFLLTIFLVANLKSLPLVFHYRIFRPIVHSCFRKKRRHQVLSSGFRDKDLPMVFLPCITTTYTPLLEADYNLHKSNSTYFTDLDASRSHLLSYLCHYGLSVVDRELTTEGKQGMMAAIIGSVTTSFKKEIRIFQKYEVWSRILTWDRKWLYIVTHFVQKGSVKPNAPATRISSMEKPSKESGGAGSKNDGNTTALPVIFATSVSKYVFKKGRLTVAPERLLRASGLLGEHETTKYVPIKEQGTQADSSNPSISKNNENVASLETSEVIEEERLKGMKYANAWDELEPLHEELLKENQTTGGVSTIGQFNDFAGYGISYC